MISDSWTNQKENFQKFVWNTIIISIHGLVYFHQITKQILVEFSLTKDAISLKPHQWFFLEWIELIPRKVYDKVNQFNVLVLFSNEMDGWGSSFSPQKSLCIVMASNKSSNNTVMRDRVLVIVWLNDESLEFAIPTLTATQNIACPYLLGFWQIFETSIQFKPRGEKKWHQHQFSVNLLIMGFNHVPVI